MVALCTYSSRWFEVFAQGVDPAQTAREVSFIASSAPAAEYPRVLDLACGTGRHALALAESGYEVLAVDRDRAAFQQSSAPTRGALSFKAVDMRDMDEALGSRDLVISMWASFGYFTDEENQALLSKVAAIIRPGGRAIFDLYHRAFFETHNDGGVRPIGEGAALEQRRLDGDRMVTTLTYPDGETDRFSWKLWSPETFTADAAASGLTVIATCSGFDPARPASASQPRFQIVLRKAAG